MNEVLNVERQNLSGNVDDLFRYTSGPRDAQIILVGEAWGSEEESACKPFMGQSGQELNRILVDAGLQRSDILTTNLVSARPPQNDFTHFLHPTKEKVNAELRGIRPKPLLLQSYHDLHRLILTVDPKLVIVAGNWPLWALTPHADVTTTVGFKTPKGIAKWRGSQTFSIPIGADAGYASHAGNGGLRHLGSGECGAGNGLQRANSLNAGEISGRVYPVLPIIHPAAILREWGWRAITVHDLRRGARYVQQDPAREDEHGRRRPLGARVGWEPGGSTFQLHKPTWEQIRSRLTIWRSQLHSGSELWLSVDLETWRRKYISVIGLADSSVELCVPLFSGRPRAGRPGETEVVNYLTLAQECEFFAELKVILEHPNVRIIGQNFIYDTEWLHRYYNIRAIVSFDTMVAHHLLFPGTPKRLDYLASLYCSHYLYWKDESRDWDSLPEDADRYWKYNCKDTRATYEIAMVLKDVIAKQPGMEALYAFQLEQWTLSRNLMLKGTAFDTSLQKEMRLQLLEEANHLADWLLSAVPASWRYTSTGKPWYDSPKGTADILYQVLGLPQVLQKKTKRPTTDDSALQELSERKSSSWLKPLFDRLRHLRSLGVFTSNFLEAKASPDGRIRCSFNIAHPETFRWSSNSNGFGEGTNLQNIPKGDKEVVAEEELENGDDLVSDDL